MVKMSITFSQIGSHGNNTYINKIYLFGVKRKVNTDNYCDWLPEEGNLLSKLKIVISEWQNNVHNLVSDYMKHLPFTVSFLFCKKMYVLVCANKDNAKNKIMQTNMQHPRNQLMDLVA